MSKKRKTKGRIRKVNKRRAVILSISLITILAVLAGILSVALTTGNKSIHKFDGEIMNGIDVSSHNGKIDWDKASKEIDFAFIRAGYRGYSNGAVAIDKKLKKNLKGANDNNVPVGVYFYSQAVNEDEAVEEAELVIKEIKRYDIGLPVVIDYEYAQDKAGKHIGRLYDARLSKSDATKVVNAFCTRIEKEGYTSAVYASSYFYNYVLDAEKLNKASTIWVADYNAEPTYKGDLDIWQYTNKGSCNGVSSKYVDWNYWYIED